MTANPCGAHQTGTDMPVVRVASKEAVGTALPVGHGLQVVPPGRERDLFDPGKERFVFLRRFFGYLVQRGSTDRRIHRHDIR